MKKSNEINLKKIGAKWLVDISIENMLKGAGDASPNENPMGGGEEGAPMKAADTSAIDSSAAISESK